MIDPLATMIDGWIASGQIGDHGSHQSARQLVAVITGQIRQPALLTGTHPMSARVDDIAAGAAQMHLSACAVRAA